MPPSCAQYMTTLALGTTGRNTSWYDAVPPSVRGRMGTRSAAFTTEKLFGTAAR
jgi:hypothetical protein